MAKITYPITPAIRYLKSINAEYEAFQYNYEDKGGTKHTAEELSVDQHLVVKSLVFVSDTKEVLMVLMHGDFEVSTKELARILSCKTINPADINLAQKHTGYQFGGTSPFGTLKQMSIFVEKSIFDCPHIYINGGKRGFILKINPNIIKSLNQLQEIEVAIK